MDSVEVPMDRFDGWLNDMAAKSLPGGVAAAAVSAAMGAALIAKAARLTLRRQELEGVRRQSLEAVLELSHSRRAELMRLAGADEPAYRAVLKSRTLPATSPVRRQAWQEATEVPVRVAEAARAVLDGLHEFDAVCWPSVCVDFEIGASLLAAGMSAALLAADNNLHAWGDEQGSRALRRRIDVLLEGKS
jgi:formiminotetrahydrofolate cyclodeaminase